MAVRIEQLRLFLKEEMEALLTQVEPWVRDTGLIPSGEVILLLGEGRASDLFKLATEDPRYLEIAERARKDRSQSKGDVNRHRTMEELVQYAREESADIEDANVITIHLRSCPECAERYTDYKAILELMKRLGK